MNLWKHDAPIEMRVKSPFGRDREPIKRADGAPLFRDSAPPVARLVLEDSANANADAKADEHGRDRVVLHHGLDVMSHAA